MKTFDNDDVYQESIKPKHSPVPPLNFNIQAPTQKKHGEDEGLTSRLTFQNLVEKNPSIKPDGVQGPIQFEDQSNLIPEKQKTEPELANIDN